MKVTALQELGKLAAIQKSLVADALPDIYKALEDKDAGIRAAAAHVPRPVRRTGRQGRAAPHEDVEERQGRRIRPDRRSTRTCEHGTEREGRTADAQHDREGPDKKSKLGQAAKQAAKSIKGEKK